MQMNQQRLRYSGQVSAPGPFTKALAVIAGATLLALGLMFSVVLVGVALVVGSVAAGWFWWKTRALRRDLREQMARMRGEAEAAMDGRLNPRDSARESPTIIEGDFIRERSGSGDQR